jgi:hypothetical protein
MSEYNLYVLFNKNTKKVVSFTFDIDVFPEQIRNNFLIKTFNFSDLAIKDNTINLARFKWVGDYDDGKLVDVFDENITVVSEKDLDKKYKFLFNKKYNIDEILHELILNADMKTEKGKDIQNFLTKTINKKEKEKEFYKNSKSHIFESSEQIEDRQKKAFSI